MYDLGGISYLGLYSKDAVKNTVLGITNNWKWTPPTNLQARKAPVLFLSVLSAYVDDSQGASAGVPHLLRLKIPAENFYANETTAPYIAYPIVCQMSRDTPAGHWFSVASENNPVIQVPSNLQVLEFDIVDGGGNVIGIDSGAGETLNIILKLIHPAHNEVRDNTLMSYAQSTVGNPPFNRL